MIGILVDGRMGNQLFQYAVALNFAKKYKTSFFIHQRQIKYRFILPKYFILPGYYRYLNSFKTRLYNGILNNKFKLLDFKTSIYRPISNISYINKYSYLEGYYQSELYFKESRNEIIKSFQIKRKHKRLFEEKYKHIFDKSKIVAIHVRRTDYVIQGDDNIFVN